MMIIFDKKPFVRVASAAVSVLMIAGAGLLAGCAAKDSSTVSSTAVEKSTAVVGENKQEKVMADFKTLLGSNPGADKVIAFINGNISSVSKEDASAMVNSLEEIQKKSLTQLEGKYYSGEDIQSKMTKVYKPGFELSAIDDIQDKELKALLVETRDGGYRVETAEGMYFPMINYEIYKKYSAYVTEDIKDYVDIMAVESGRVPAKDAALIIGWDEIINRALAQEKFIKNHGSSAKVEDVRQLLKKYFTFILFGANNTPLFSYDSKMMVPGAKSAYENAVKNGGDSTLMKIVGKYLDVLGKSGYKLGDSVEKFRKDAAENTVF